MEALQVIEALDRDALTPLVQRSLDADAVDLTHWQTRPLGYSPTNPWTAALVAVHGSATVRGARRDWSFVVKVVRRPEDTLDPADWSNADRERLAYLSGLLDDLPGCLVAPRMYGALEHDGGLVSLWLEHVIDVAGRPWPVERHGVAARHLGHFNGVYLTSRPLPVVPWLSQGMLRGWITIMESIAESTMWEMPLLQRVFPGPLADRARRLWEQRETLLAAVDQLPQTLCHLDAGRPNLLARRDGEGVEQTVAIDWSMVGRAAVGEEIVPLAADSLLFCELEAGQGSALAENVFAGYRVGLHDAGWRGDERLVRLGFTAAYALRYGAIHPMWVSHFLDDPARHDETEQQFGHSVTEIEQQWTALAPYWIGMADEAFQLLVALER